MASIDDVSIELWIDQPPKVVLNPGYFRTLADLHIDAIYLMIESLDRRWDPSWTHKDIEKALKLADPYALEVGVTTWPWPDPLWMDAAFPWLETALAIGPIAGEEGDLEFNWKSKTVSGFFSTTERDPVSAQTYRKSALDHAGDRYVAEKLAMCDRHQVRPEATTFTSHVEGGINSDVARLLKRLKVQAYSIESRKQADGTIFHVPWNHLYGPGNMQRFSLDRTFLIPEAGNELEIVAGLGWWDQHWQGHSVEEAMMSAINTSLRYNIVGLSGWSSKWIMPSSDKFDKDVFNVLRSLRS